MIPVGLLLLSGVALVWLQYYQATGEITPRPLLHLLGGVQRQVERVPLELTRVTPEEETRIGRELTQQWGPLSSNLNAEETKRIVAYLD